MNRLDEAEQWERQNDLLHGVVADIADEMDAARQKHGPQVYLPDAIWALIASEEAGEAVKDALQEQDVDVLYGEVVQAATMFTEWAINLRIRGVIGWHDGWQRAEFTQIDTPRSDEA